MLVRKLLFVAAVVGSLTVTARTFAQDQPRDTGPADSTYPQDQPAAPQKPKSFVERLDAFGKKVFGGILPAKKNRPKPSDVSEPSETGEKPAAPSKDPRIVSRHDMLGELTDEEPAAPRAGSVLEKPNSQSAQHDDRTLSMDEFLPTRKPPAARAEAEEETPNPAPRSLHERMAGFRNSPFDADDQADSGAHLSAPPQPPADTTVQREKKDIDSDNEPIYPEDQAAARRVAPAAQAMAPRPAEPIHEAENERANMVEPRPNAADDSLPPAPIYEARNERAAAAAPQPSAAESRAADNPARVGTLFARKGPVLGVETLGPRTIVVGRASTYQVQITNAGNVAAEEMVVHVTLPPWAEVARIEASLGEAKPPEAAPPGAIDWRLGRLEARSRERLTIRIIPRQSRPFDLAVRWESKPVVSQAMIEVQEPKLSLQLEGPHEVSYGKKEVYHLKLANTGSGSAENVAIVTTPVGAGENLPASYNVGLLAAGEEKTLDVELTAREGGLLSIHAEAHGDGGLHAELLEKVLVHRAGLKLDVAGPKVQFVGAVATYSICVGNPGNAPARNVNFSVALPAGAAYLSGIDGARYDRAENRLVWGLETLPIGGQRRFAIKCRLATVGMTPVRVNATAEDDLIAVAETSVRVETVATLTMDVKDPTSPVPVGEESVYEIHVRNRGTREAQNVEVFAYFSRGVEPTATEGAPSRLLPGQVIFQPIASLPPAAEAVLKVHARAEIAGNHIFRAEVRCRQLDARLVSEATNLYYSDAPPPAQPSPTPSAATAPPPAENAPQGPPPPIHNALTPLMPRQ